MARKSKAVESTAKQNDTETQEIKGINIPPIQETCVKTHLNAPQIEENAETSTNIEEKPKNKVGRPPATNKVDYEKLESFASQNIENYKIAEALDIGVSTFYRLMNEDINFKQAYERGMENRKYELEKALYKRASGFEAQEVVTEKDEKGNVIKTKVTDKSYVPDTTAAIFALKNVYSEKYKDRIETVTDININYNQIQKLTNEELVKLASNAVEAEYSIE